MAIPNLSDPPTGWAIVRLGDVLALQRHAVEPDPAQAYREIGIRSHGKGIFHKPEVTGDDLGDKRVFRVVPDCLVLNIVFAWEGAVAVTSANESGMIASHRFPMFSPARPDIVDVEFLRRYFVTKHGTKLLGDVSPGGAGRNRTLNQSSFASLAIPLPPLPEQKKIAAILSSVDEVIAKTEAVIAQLQIVKKAMMEQLLTKGMPDRHTRFKQTEIGEIPEEWEVVRAGELCEVITKGATPKVVTSAAPDCVPFLRVQNIGRRGEIDLSGSALFVTERTHTTELTRSQIRPGDVLMNIVGPPLGKVAVVPISIPKANINQAIALLRPARIESEYLSLCLTAEHLFAWLLKQAKRTSSQLNLTLESCREFPLPLPERSERREIIACTVAMQLILDAQQTELVALREVKSSLSSSLLSGELRVIPEVAE